MRAPEALEFRLIDSTPDYNGLDIAAFNMAVDEAISRSVSSGLNPPTIRFYDWKIPSITIGSFQKFEGLNIDFLKHAKLPVAKRPTGGRAILHGYELTYSLASRYDGPFRGDLFHCYGLISRAFESAFREMGLPVQVTSRRKKSRESRAEKNAVCFQALSFAEIGVDGKKIIGSAQKRSREGFLQQGSVPFIIDRELHKKVFSGFDPGAMAGLAELLPIFNAAFFKALLKTTFERGLGARLIPGELTCEEIRLAAEILPNFRIPLP